MQKRIDFPIQLWIILWLAFCPVLKSQPGLQESEMPEVLATVERFGGFAGVHDEFTLYRDGKVTNAEGAIYQLPGAELKAIVERMRGLDLPKSCQIVFPTGFCSDCFQYRITLRHPSGQRVISMDTLQMAGTDSISTLARIIRDLVSRIKQ